MVGHHRQIHLFGGSTRCRMEWPDVGGGGSRYDPLWKNAIMDWTDLALALAAFLLLTLARMPPLLVVVVTTIAAVAVAA